MKDPMVRKRKVSLKILTPLSEMIRIEERLMKIDGIISVDLDVQKKVLKINYDLRKTKFEFIEKSIEELGLELSPKLFQRLKRGMAKFTEQNELDNLNAPLSSCCDDPKESSRICSSCVKH